MVGVRIYVVAAVVLVVLLTSPCDGAAHLKKHHKHVIKSGKKKKTRATTGKSQKMQLLLSMLEKFKSSAAAHQKDVEANHMAEGAKLQNGMATAIEDGTKVALQQSISSNEESMLETEKIYDNMVDFADAMTHLVNSAHTQGSACEVTTCGLHAACTNTMAGAVCVCNEGYVGNGQNCHAPPEFKPHSLLANEGRSDMKTADMDVCLFADDKVAVVFRDTTDGNIGRLMVGRIFESGSVKFSPSEQFTQPNEKAYDPVVQASPDKRLLIAWRDQAKSGNGWVRGAALGTTAIRGADLAITWGVPFSVATRQGHKMAMVSVENNRFAVMYSDVVSSTHHDTSFGNSLFAEVAQTGAVSELGRYRFADFPVCRLEVTKVTPTAFVLAARGTSATDDMDPNVLIHQEAVAVYGEAVGSDLMFNPNSVNLEPAETDIWARGISLIAPYTVAYAYQDGKANAMKMAVMKIDPTTKGFNVLQQPAVIGAGVSPYVSMLNMPYTPEDPHTLIYYQSKDGASSRVNLCSWSTKESALQNCQDFTWLGEPVTTVSGAHLDGGKALMVFATESGTPFYSLFGLSKR